jgi:hypothetical protein
MLPGSRLEVFSDAGHFPFNDHPDRFVDLMRNFIETTKPAVMNEEHIRTMLQERGNLTVSGEPGI